MEISNFWPLIIGNLSKDSLVFLLESPIVVSIIFFAFDYSQCNHRISFFLLENPTVVSEIFGLGLYQIYPLV